MARERPFKAELVDVRTALPDSRRADREHLHRWEDDWRAQEILDKFKAHNPAASPKEFIDRHLKIRQYVNRISDSKDWHKEWRKYFAKCGTEIFDPRRSFSDRMATLRILYRDAALALSVYKNRLPPPQYISRQTKTRKHDKTQRIETQNEDNWRARKLCMILIGALWHEHCGAWDDEAVAALTEIAIPGPVIEAHQVRGVRRQYQATTGKLTPGKIA